MGSLEKWYFLVTPFPGDYTYNAQDPTGRLVGPACCKLHLHLNMWNQVQACSVSKSELATSWMAVTPTVYRTTIFIQSSGGEEGEQKV